MSAALEDPRIQKGMRRQFALFEQRKQNGPEYARNSRCGLA